MNTPARPSRTHQRLRARRDLLHAASRLLKGGRTPTMEEVAEEAMVSRATAYRYFPSIEALLVEAPLDVDAPDPGALFADSESLSPEDRIDKAEAALHAMTYRNEAQLRLLLAYAIKLPLEEADDRSAPRRQNRRIPLIEEALAPIRGELDEPAFQRLCAALAVYFGPEAMVVFEDVLQIPESEARGIKSWAVRALVRGAMLESEAAP